MKHVLLTGSTGVIGSALVPQLLTESDVVLELLVRANSDEALQCRKEQLLAYWKLNAVDANKLRFLRGDVTQSWLGISEPIRYSLLTSVTHIVHAAGNVKLNQTVEAAQRSAVESAQNILQFAGLAVARGQLKKVEMVSTIGVAGRFSGLVMEDRIDAGRNYRNTYEAAKAAAEHLCWSAIDHGLPVTIHRPSMVVGDSRTGQVISFQVFYHICEFLTGRRSWGWLPLFGNVTLDIVPVDYVVAAIHASMNNPQTTGRALHLCAGPDEAWPLEDLMQEVRRYYVEMGSTLPTLHRAPVRAFEHAMKLLGRVTIGRTARFMQALPHFFAYLKEQQQFCVETTAQVLGIPLPRMRTNQHSIDSLLKYHNQQIGHFQTV